NARRSTPGAAGSGAHRPYSVAHCGADEEDQGDFMRIVTPAEVAGQTQNKYLGVLVAAKFARYVNDFPRDRSVDWEEKLTTRAFDELVRGNLKYRLVRRRRQQEA